MAELVKELDETLFTAVFQNDNRVFRNFCRIAATLHSLLGPLADPRAMPPPQTPASFPLHKSQRSFQHACFLA